MLEKCSYENLLVMKSNINSLIPLITIKSHYKFILQNMLCLDNFTSYSKYLGNKP